MGDITVSVGKDTLWWQDDAKIVWNLDAHRLDLGFSTEIWKDFPYISTGVNVGVGSVSSNVTAGASGKELAKVSGLDIYVGAHTSVKIPIWDKIWTKATFGYAKGIGRQLTRLNSEGRKKNVQQCRDIEDVLSGEDGIVEKIASCNFDRSLGLYSFDRFDLKLAAGYRNFFASGSFLYVKTEASDYQLLQDSYVGFQVAGGVTF